jgi:hypothetical protein
MPDDMKAVDLLGALASAFEIAASNGQSLDLPPREAAIYSQSLRALLSERRKMVEALRAADQFIANGIEFGFIRMPDPGTPDPAHKTHGLIRAALTGSREHG